MPTVRKQVSQVQTRQAPDTGVNLQTDQDTFGAGRFGNKVYEEADKFIGEVGKYAQEQKNIADEMAVRDADLALLKEQVRIETEAKNQFKGRDSAKAVEWADDQWGKARDAVRKTLSNRVQERAFEQRYAERGGAINKSLQIYTASQFEAHDKLQLEEVANANRIYAGAKYTDPEEVQKSIKATENEIKRYANIYIPSGLRKDWVDSRIKDARQNIHIEIASRMMYDGNLDLAKQYLQQAEDKGELDADGIGVIKRIEKEQRALEQARREAYEYQVRKAINDNQYGLAELKADRNAGRVDESFYESQKKVILNPYDDIEIPQIEKASKLIEIQDLFLELGGKVNASGIPSEPTSKSHKEKNIKLRKMIEDSKRYLPKTTYIAYINFTQRKYNEALNAKLSYMYHFMNVSKYVIGSAGDVVQGSVNKLMEMMDDNVPIEKFKDAVSREKEVQAINTNPNRSRYKEGDTITNADGITFDITGYYENGDPKFDNPRRERK